jgi:hypothetical protein
MRLAGLLALAVFIPHAALAAVRINEIAWMGSAVSANAEWIELANTGDAPVALSGWTLSSSTGSPDIALSGTIAANGFYLLERTSDDAVPAVPADQVYTGTLPNGGAVLTLKNADGAAVDTVDGSGSWANIGGDNTTKETAQRTESGWVTAPATPRAQNAAAGDANTPGSDTTASSTSAVSSSASVYVPPPTGALTVSLREENAMSYRNAPLSFTALARTKSGAEDGNASFVWSFGDGSSAVGSEVEKTYRYAGTYLVEVRASDGAAKGEADFVVTVSDAKLRIASVSGDGITLANDTDARVDLSRYELVSGMSTFRMPLSTTLLPRSETMFPYTITNLPVSFSVHLLYPDGLLAAAYGAPEVPPATTTAALPVQPVAAAAGSYMMQNKKSAPGITNVTAPASAHAPDAARATTTDIEPAAVVAAFSTTAPEAAAPSAARAGILSSPWTLGFLGVVVLAGAAVMVL